MFKLKIIKPTTPSLRHVKLLFNCFSKKKKPLYCSTKGFARSFGRNNQGVITAWHRGGGHKRLYRVIDHSDNFELGIIIGIEKDPYRNSFILRLFNPVTRSFFYRIASKNLFLGSIVRSGSLASLKVGNVLPFTKIPVGVSIHSIGSFNKKACYVKSAGTCGVIVQKTNSSVVIKLPSGKLHPFKLNDFATIGKVSNESIKLVRQGKAGRNRWKNMRPIVRGVAMNPIDHPHGGGEGKTSGGRPSVTPWGKPTKGPKTSRSIYKNFK
jgi:large subunit ribosomal protein L2